MATTPEARRRRPPGRDSAASQSPAAGRAGFTLVEMLVVMGIIITLAGIALVGLNVAYRKGDRARTMADLQAIATALEAYYQDHGTYPRVLNDAINPAENLNGAQVLCQALMAPRPATTPNRKPLSDGADGLGFRTRRSPGADGVMFTGDDIGQGKVFGPYLQVERFRINYDAGTGKSEIIDRYGKPILYFPAYPKKINVSRAVQSPRGNVPGLIHTDPLDASEYSLFDADDNLTHFMRPVGNTGDNTPALNRIRLMLGDFGGPGGALPPDGMITTDTGEEHKYPGKFILWSSGPNELFGPEIDDSTPNTALDRKDADKCDDIVFSKQ
jgi:general secretion pathway protein G